MTPLLCDRALMTRACYGFMCHLTVKLASLFNINRVKMFENDKKAQKTGFFAY